MSDKEQSDKQGLQRPQAEEPDVTMVDAGEGGPGEDPDYDEAGEGDDGVDDRR